VAERTGATLTILPADSASIWGLRPYFSVVDELTQWHATPRTLRVWEGLTTGLAKVHGSRLCVLGTAGTLASDQGRQFQDFCRPASPFVA